MKEPIERIDRFGLCTMVPSPGSAGRSSPACRQLRTSRPTRFAAAGFRLDSRRIFFIGRHPDQVRCWPAEPAPEYWSPIWAISITRRGRAVYCGPSTVDAGPLPRVPGRDRDPLWRGCWWQWRHRVVPPLGSAAASSLWNQYQEAARHTAIGDALLFVLSARRTMSRASFRARTRAFGSPRVTPVVAPTYAVRSVIETFDALGHCEQGANGELSVAPATLALLPWPGLPRAVLCGARSPETLTSLQEAAHQYGVRVTSTGQGSSESPAPARIEVSAECLRESRRNRLALWVALSGSPHQPSRWRRLVHQLTTTSAAWSGPRTPNSTGREVTSLPGKLRFDQRARCDGNLRLSQYRHPDGYSVRDYLWRDGLGAATDRSWGRFAVLADSGLQPMRYEPRSGTVLVPVTTPLPRLFARSLGLSSGLAPGEVTDHVGPAMRAYAGVPAGLASVISEKLVAAERIQVT